MKVEFDIKLKQEDLFRFNMHQTYSSVHGILSVLIAVVIWVMAGVSAGQGAIAYAVLYIVMGILVLFYIPFTLWTRVKRTLKTNQVLANTLHYCMEERAIIVSQGDETGELSWDQIYKMTATKKQVLIYSNRINAYIIPRDQLGDNYEQVRKLAKAQLPAYRFKMK